MFKIGDFSKLAQVSVKTLRYYGERGLLKPAWIDRYTGYRYYTAEQLPRLNRILTLKELGFSLEQITALLREDLPYTELRGMMRLKQAELARRIQAEQSRLARVEARLQRIEQEGALPRYEVVRKSVPPQLVVGVRQVLPGLAHLPALFDELYGYLQVQSALAEASFPSLAVYYDAEFNEERVDVEAAVPVSRRLPPDERWRMHELPGVEHMACAIHQGGYEGLGEAYSALLTWAEVSGYRVVGPNRELYLQPPQPERQPGDYITEVQLPVEKKPVSIYLTKELENQIMEPKIVSKPAFTAVGLAYHGKNENNEIPELWGRFNPRMPEIKHIVDGAFGVCTPAEADGRFKYLAGFAVSSTDEVPEGMEVWQVPAHQYAVFPTTLPKISETYKYAFETWLPGSGYKYASRNPDYEYYDENFDAQDPESLFEIYIPIK